MWEETVVEVHHDQELQQGLHSVRAWETGDGVHLGREGNSPQRGDMVAEESDGLQANLDETMLTEPTGGSGADVCWGGSSAWTNCCLLARKNPVCLHSQRPVVSGGKEGGAGQCSAGK